MAEAKKKTTRTTKADAALRKATTRRKRVTTPTHDEIATRAYYLSLEGFGDPTDHWLRAERELAVV